MEPSTEIDARPPCRTEGCPGDSRYMPPGRGHADNCTVDTVLGLVRPDDCQCEWDAIPPNIACPLHHEHRVTPPEAIKEDSREQND